MTGSRLLAFALCVMLFACPPPSRDDGAAAPEPQRPDEVAAEVVAAFTAFAEAIDAKDWATAGTFYAESPSFRWWEDGQLRYPNAGTARAALEGLAAYGPLTVRYGAPDVIALGPDAATLSVTFADSDMMGKEEQSVRRSMLERTPAARDPLLEALQKTPSQPKSPSRDRDFPDSSSGSGDQPGSQPPLPASASLLMPTSSMVNRVTSSPSPTDR